jgi:hypothetical protein
MDKNIEEITIMHICMLTHVGIISLLLSNQCIVVIGLESKAVKAIYRFSISSGRSSSCYDKTIKEGLLYEI